MKIKIHYMVFLPVILVFFSAFIGTYVIREPFQRFVFSFLSLNKPIKGQVLVIEGWLSDCMLKEAAAEYMRGQYSYCLISGTTRSSHSSANILMRFGVDSGAVKFTDAPTGMGHNTYHMALAASQWLHRHDPAVSTLNIFTAGPHGRKSWIIFKRVFGHAYSVGVLSSSIERCDTARWWGPKQRTRIMVKYGIGYIYARVWPFEV